MNKFALSLTIAALIATPAMADEAALQAKVDALSAQLEALKQDIKSLHSQTEAIATQQEAAPSKTAASSENSHPETGATLWGYGEINYNRPKDDTSQTQMDLRRAIFGIGYKFNDSTRFVSEFEVEHAIASAGDAGEVAVEQFYVDHQLTANTHLKAGLFLIPAGLLNEGHEPTNYYGVERNFVETAIIPTTWREGGLAFFGTTESGLAWDTGVTTTVDLSGWDASSDEGRESPLGSIHQELQLAKASDLGIYGALNYRAIPGFVVGGSIFTSKLAQNNPDLRLAKDARMTLWDLHSRWTPGNWDLSALYARGTISDTKALNLTFAGFPTPVPNEFFGWYAQAAYKLWQNGDYKLSPFVRYEGVNTAAAYEAMPLGLGVATATTEHITTLGASFYLHPNVVIKLDYQDFDQDSARNRLNLGLGLAF
jgi:outer membrane murein-binding lipoprotein Lpp